MNFSFEIIIENDKCVVTGLLHKKTGRNKYSTGKKEGKTLIFIYDHFEIIHTCRY